jgi:hypothetical protein
MTGEIALALIAQDRALLFVAKVAELANDK